MVISPITMGRTPGPLYLLGLLPALLIVLGSGIQPWIPVDHLYRDVGIAARQITDGSYPPYLGLISNLGIMLWTGATAVCFFGGLIVKRRAGLQRAALFLFCGAGVSGLLAVDDFFLVHELIFPRYLGLAETYAYGLYGVLTLAYLIVFHKEIWAVGPQLLIFSLAIFAFGLVVEILYPSGQDLRRLAENGSKFVGITLWATFHMWAACRLLDGPRSPSRS